MKPWQREVLINVVVAGQLADIATTVYGINAGVFREGNPLAAFIIKRFGWHTAILLKLGLTVWLAKQQSALVGAISWTAPINNVLLIITRR